MSDGEDVSTPDLIRAIAKALGKPARLIAVPPAVLRLGATLAGRGAAFDRLAGSLALDTSALLRDLGWQPPQSMADGIEAVARWYRSLGR